GFLLCQYNISALAGNSNVAFRVRFKSDVSATAAGAAIDDFEITGLTNAPLPVSFISFNGENVNGTNLLQWFTASEINNNGFEVYRSSDSKNFKKIGFVLSSLSSSQIHVYNFNDDDIVSNLRY